MKARLFQPTKSAMSSGQAKTRKWALEIIHDGQFKRDPLMGWNGTTSTWQQVELTFDTIEQAQAFASKNDIELEVELGAKMAMKPKSYSSNFSYSRKQPWSH